MKKKCACCDCLVPYVRDENNNYKHDIKLLFQKSIVVYNIMPIKKLCLLTYLYKLYDNIINTYLIQNSFHITIEKILNKKKYS